MADDSGCSVTILLFHGEVKDFLGPGNRTKDPAVIRYPADRAASVKDVIEALGCPHTEVGRIELMEQGGGDSASAVTEVDFHHPLTAGQTLAIHPHSVPREIKRATPLRPVPLPTVRFVADANVGRLATYMRLLGLDTAYDFDMDDAALAKLSAAEGRIVLTRDRKLLMRSRVVFGRCIRAQDPKEQVREVVRVFGLKPPFALGTRCTVCNHVLEQVEKSVVLHRLEPKTKRYYDVFRICPNCDKVYWAGSHHDRMRAHFADILGKD